MTPQQREYEILKAMGLVPSEGQFPLAVDYQPMPRSYERTRQFADRYLDTRHPEDYQPTPVSPYERVSQLAGRYLDTRHPEEYPNQNALVDPFDRSRAVVNRLTVRPGITVGAGLAGLGAAAATLDSGKATRAIEGVSRFAEPFAQLSEPKTEGGRALTGKIDAMGEFVHGLGTDSGDWVYNKTGSPALATLASTGIQAIPLAGVRGAFKGKPSAQVVDHIPGGTTNITPKAPIMLNEGAGTMLKSLYESLTAPVPLGYNKGKPTGGKPAGKGVPNELLRSDDAGIVGTASTTTGKNIPTKVEGSSPLLDQYLPVLQSENFGRWADKLPVDDIVNVDLSKPTPRVNIVRSSQFKGIEEWDPTIAAEKSYSGMNNPERLWGTTEKSAESHRSLRDAPEDYPTETYAIKAENPISLKIQGKKATQEAMTQAAEAGHDVAYLYDDQGSKYVVALKPATKSTVKNLDRNTGAYGDNTSFIYEGMGEMTKRALDPIFKPVGNPQKEQLWRMDMESIKGSKVHGVKYGKFDPSRDGWVSSQEEIPTGKHYGASKPDVYKGLTSPGEDHLVKGKDIKGGLSEDYSMPIEMQDWSVGRPAQHAKMVQVSNKQLLDFQEKHGMDKDQLRDYLLGDGVTHVKITGMVIPGENFPYPNTEIIQIAPESSKFRGRVDLYEGMGRALYDSLVGATPQDNDRKP